MAAILAALCLNNCHSHSPGYDGSTRYSYNAYGELLSQKDAKHQVTSYSYDALGRVAARQEPEGQSTWTYDTAPKSGGSWRGLLDRVQGYGGDITTYRYDTVGRVSQETQQYGGAAEGYSLSYDSAGRIARLTYPGGLAVDHGYAANGELKQISAAATPSLVYWRADARDGWGRVTQETQGNGLVTQRRYSGIFPALIGLQSPVQATGYWWNGLLNLTQRSDSQVSPALTETFGYDALNRLTQSQVNGLAAITYSYDAVGNLTAKSDVGTLTYPASGQPRPHAVLERRRPELRLRCQRQPSAGPGPHGVLQQC